MKIKYLILIFLTFASAVNLYGNNNDSDNDSISNKYDKCPDTPDGVCVTKDGCIKEIKRIINFDSSSYEIKKTYISKLNKIKEIALECFGYKIIISGHTDSTADEKFNQNLSKNRALAVKNFLVLNGLDEKRITVKWFGETKPIATNITKDGRFANRRVEILFN